MKKVIIICSLVLFLLFLIFAIDYSFTGEQTEQLFYAVNKQPTITKIVEDKRIATYDNKTNNASTGSCVEVDNNNSTVFGQTNSGAFYGANFVTSGDNSLGQSTLEGETGSSTSSSESTASTTSNVSSTISTTYNASLTNSTTSITSNASSTNSTTQNSVESYTVTFDGNGGTPMRNTITVRSGNTIQRSSVMNPSRRNATFVGWYLDDAPFDFSTPIRRNITLKAMWHDNRI